LAGENDIDDWANTEFGAANLGDARLERRLVALARRLACSPQSSFPQSLNAAELKAAYRFSTIRRSIPTASSRRTSHRRWIG
jgi:Transposase DNA-binding